MKNGIMLGIIAGLTASFTIVFLEKDDMKTPSVAHSDGVESTIDASSPVMIALRHIATHKHVTVEDIETILALDASRASNVHLISVVAKDVKDALESDSELTERFNTEWQPAECDRFTDNDDCLLAWMMKS